MRSRLRRGRGLDARAQRRDQALAPRGRAAPAFASGQEDQEAVGAHGVQADDVLRPELARAAWSDASTRRELAHRPVVGGPAQLGLVPAGAAEVEVDDVGGALRLDDAAHVLEHRGQRRAGR